MVRRQHFGIATLVAPHLSAIGSEAAFMHGGFAHHTTRPAEDRGRMAHAIRISDNDGRRTTVAHLHGVRMASGKGDTPQRRGQAEELAALVGRVQGSRRPGGRGRRPQRPADSVTFDVLGRAGLTDLVGATDTRTSVYTKPARHADYLFVSDPGTVASFTVLTAPEVSDHRPLVLDVRPTSSLA